MRQTYDEIISDYQVEAVRQQLAWEISKQKRVYVMDGYRYSFARKQPFCLNQEFVEYIPEPRVTTTDASR